MIDESDSKGIPLATASIHGKPPLHVAVAIVVNSKGEILIARRPEGVHLEGLWEFPGGKLEQDETVFSALQRELQEETNIQIKSGRQLIKIIHKYPEKTVKLDTWLIKEWSGLAEGLEGQEIRWVNLSELQDYELPEADRPIISALNLPLVYQISPEPDQNIEVFLDKLETCLASGVKLFQLRAKTLSRSTLGQLTDSVRQLCDKYQTRWLINGVPEDVKCFNADGVHLSSDRLMALADRPLNDESLVGASCHNTEELEHAVHIGVDFAVLSPVNKTLSHPDVKPIGLKKFEHLIEGVNIPVYALGGMSHADLELAWEHGAQGVAMIRAGWPVNLPD